MAKSYDFPLYRSDANDPEEKESKDTRGQARPHEKLAAPQPDHIADYVKCKETELKLAAERKLAEAAEKNAQNDKTLDSKLMGQMNDPRHEIS